MYIAALPNYRTGALAGARQFRVLHGGGLGFSIGKSLKRAVRKPLELHKKVAHKIGSFVKRQWKKDLGRLKKVIGKYGKWIALAAQILNFIPGLGIAVGLAIAAAAAAIAAGSAMINMRASAAAAKKAEDQTTVDAAKASQEEANAAMDDAYLKGEKYFGDNYKMTADKWKGLTYDQKSRFMNEVVFDQHAKVFAESGVTKEAFTKMPVEKQHDLIAQLGAAFELEGEKLPFEEDFLGLPIFGWLAIGGAIAIAVPLVSYLMKRKSPVAA